MSLKSRSALAPAFIISVSLLPACGGSQTEVHHNPPGPDPTITRNPPQPDPDDPEETPLLVPEQAPLPPTENPPAPPTNPPPPSQDP